MSFADYIYNQFSGFAKAGQKLKPAETKTDRVISRIISVSILLVCVGIVLFVSAVDFLSWSTKAKAMLTLLLLLLFSWRFWQGISIPWILKGLLKYWLATLMLILLFGGLIYIAAGMFTGTIKEEEIIFIAGTLIFLIGFFLVITFFRGAKKSDTAVKKSGAIIMVLFWAIFLVGGLIAIAFGLGLLD